MTDALLLMASLAAGAGLGGVFFGGLWLTVDGLERSRRPALRMIASLVLRFALVLGAFFAWAKVGGWPHLLAAAAGFMLCRLTLVKRMSRPGTEDQT